MSDHSESERSFVEDLYLESVLEEDSESDQWPIICADPASKRVMTVARSVSGTPATVLLTGESGVGKEVFARFIHRSSSRASGPFIAINCSALPPDLLESELFGHEKGAFTGAVKRHEGVFERANGGTLLLDEITETTMATQAKLLRVIQEREIVPVGGSAPKKVDIRIIAASNRDLGRMVDEGNFRRDLYYRINVFPIAIPPLRQRPGDIEPLFRFYVEKLSSVFGRSDVSVDDSAIARLREHDFPGNVRELVNVVQRAMILSTESPHIDASHIVIGDGRENLLRLESAAEIAADIPIPESKETDDRVSFKIGEDSLSDVRRVIILETLRRFDGNRTQTADALGVSVRTIRSKLKKYQDQSD